MNVYGRIDETTETSHYRYRDRSDNRIESVQDQETKKRTPTPFFSILIGSAVATALSVILPFVFDLLSPQQTQDFYTGWALHQGGHVYTDYYGTNGLLYYLLTYISQGSVLFAFVEWVALFGAGIFLFKSTDILTGKGEQAKQLLGIFYLLVAGLSFGGGYAMIVALPFLFYAFSLVATYLDNPTHDKGFLRIGMSFALAFFVSPIPTALFVLSIGLSLLIFNIVQHRFVHGIYQFFAIGLGFSILFYPIGYYTVAVGNFGDAISHTLYPINTLELFSNTHLSDNSLFFALLAAGLGAVTLIFAGLFQSKPTKQYVISAVASFGLLLTLAMLILSKEPLHGSRLVVLLPFLTLLMITTVKETTVDQGVRSRRKEGTNSLWTRFLKGNLYLPIVAIVYLLLIPFVSRYASHPTTYQERLRLVATVKEQTAAGDRIYAWDDRPNLYLDSGRLAATSILTPTLYTASEENKTKLVNDLKENQPKLIVVNQRVALWEEIEKLLGDDYQLLKTDTTEFKLYQLKE